MLTRFGIVRMVALHIRPLAILLIPALLSGCATGAQREASRMQETTVETRAENQACLDSIFAKPDYVHLKTKVFLSSSSNQNAPLQYLTDNARPTKKDISDIYALHADVQKCRRITLEGAAKIHPAYATIMIASYGASDKLWAELATGRMTWGNFNTARQTIAEQSHRQMTEADVMITSQLQNQHQFEVQQRQRAAAAMQQWAFQQQVLENQRLANLAAAHASATAAMNRPIINCQYQGAGMMTCQ